MPIEKFDLEMTIVEGTFDLSYLHPSLFVETSVDGLVDQKNNTQLAKFEKGRSVWNKDLVFNFTTLEPTTPVIIAMSVLRKRTIHHGFKLVGTARFSTSELIPLLDKGMVQRKVKIHIAKHIPTTGTLTITLNLRSIISGPVDFPADDTQDPANQSKNATIAGGDKNLFSMPSFLLLLMLILTVSSAVLYKLVARDIDPHT